MTQAVTIQHEPPPFVSRPAETPASLLEFFVVQCVGYRCVAYRDQEGRWRNAFNDEELFGDVQIWK